MNSVLRRTSGDNNTNNDNNGGNWIRKRFLSFMGVTDNNNNNNNNNNATSAATPLTCSMCLVENPTVPYIASPCGHCYCYLCLRAAVTDDPLGFRCVDCGKMIVSSYRAKYC
eukprot:CAMPEP_0201639216 /NCGR_PEP_ID=MMETSP0493-20130528/18721_1 /ASSEMBLY_ACC=CAM_ASM_000838 /TAXON_ID=420259 /ORGANISM="Thalassiosira gravida, Strain GMp14c1" /LENGTH=111 /DNA_ID=CAMNT_0048112537 /DNA_START=62 /DNA_END=397 /DNA_ORIENTATION=-